MNYIVLFVNGVLRSQSLLSFLVYTSPNMHANSYRSDFFACSCRVNNTEPAVCFTVSLLKAVTQVRSPSVLILTAMSYSKSLNISLLEVMISSNNEGVNMHDLSNITVQIVFDARWASMNEA
jgi:hypothetical protein